MGATAVHLAVVPKQVLTCCLGDATVWMMILCSPCCCRGAGGARVPLNFEQTAPAYDPANPRMQRGRMPTDSLRNPQTVAFLDMLGLPYNLDRGGSTAQLDGAEAAAGAGLASVTSAGVGRK